MEQRRLILVIALAIIGFFLFQAWNEDHPSNKTATAELKPTEQTQALGFPQAQETEAVAATDKQTVAHTSASVVSDAAKEHIVSVKTDVLNVKINLRGGSLIYSSLPKFPKLVSTPDDPVVLFNESDKFRYLAQSAVIPKNQKQLKQLPLFTTSETNYQLANGEEAVQVKLTRITEQGIKISKVYTFKRGQYDVDVAYIIDNKTGNTFNGNLYNQIIRMDTPISTKKGFQVASYFGASMSTSEKPYKKVSFKDMSKENIDITTPGGWIAMQQHYFLSAWIPNQGAQNQFYTRQLNNNLFTVGSISPMFSVAPGSTTTLNNKIYIGPAFGSALDKIAPNLGLTVDYGFLWWLSEPIFWVMQKIHNVVGNWGVAIILVTFLIKLVFYKLSATSYRSMANMRKLQPKIEAIKERYGDDKQKLSQATMELYRKEKVNPLGGCLPMLIQIPFFIALYWVLVESVQLRQAPFFLWIQDLSVKDPFYILPIIMGATMFIQQKLNPPPPDPTQAKIFMLLPIVFTVIFLNFPAGLVLYWITNNTLSILQQWYVMNKHEKQTAQKSYKKKTAKT